MKRILFLVSVFTLPCMGMQHNFFEQLRKEHRGTETEWMQRISAYLTLPEHERAYRQYFNRRYVYQEFTPNPSPVGVLLDNSGKALRDADGNFILLRPTLLSPRATRIVGFDVPNKK